MPFSPQQNSTKKKPEITSVAEKAMAPHSSSLAWKIPLMEEPGGLYTLGWKESGTTEVTKHAHTHFWIPEPTLFTCHDLWHLIPIIFNTMDFLVQDLEARI